MNAMAHRFGKLLDEPQVTLFIVTEMLFLWLVINNPAELGNRGGGVILLHITFICFVQMVVLARFHRMARARGVAADYLQRSIFAIFLVFNIYSVLLVHIPSDSGMFVYKNPISVVLLVMILLLYGVKPWKFINVSSLAFGLIIGIPFVLEEAASETENVAMPSMAAAPTFKRQPNIYFLSFDALIPTDAADFFLRQSEPEYSVYLKERGFREVENTFAVAFPTGPSLNAIAAIDTSYCDRLGKDCSGLVTGIRPSPLYAILKKNGYETVFANRSNYFGNEKGPYLDRYNLRKFEFCRHIDEKSAFLGYCWLEKQFKLNAVFKIINTGQSVESLIESGIKTSPHFLMAYTFSPTHAPDVYDTYDPRHFEIYRRFFRKNQLKAVRIIETLMAAIKKRDPNSVVIVFGDHGTWVSRTWKDKLGQTDPAGIVWSEDLMTLEHHKVALYVYPKDFCVDEIRGLYPLNRLGRSIAKCLSDGQDPFSGEHRDGDRDWSQLVIPK